MLYSAALYRESKYFSHLSLHLQMWFPAPQFSHRSQEHLALMSFLCRYFVDNRIKPSLSIALNPTQTIAMAFELVEGRRAFLHSPELIRRIVVIWQGLRWDVLSEDRGHEWFTLNLGLGRPRRYLRFVGQEALQYTIYLNTWYCVSAMKWHMILLIDGLTHRGRDKMDAIFQTTVSNAISWMKMFKLRLKFHRRPRPLIFQWAFS